MVRFPSLSLSIVKVGRSVGRAKKKNKQEKNEHMIAYEISRLVCKIYKSDGKSCLLTGLSNV